MPVSIGNHRHGFGAALGILSRKVPENLILRTPIFIRVIKSLCENVQTLQEYLASKKLRTLQGPPWDPRHGPTVVPYGVAFSCK